jgi:hypothetical protein
MDIEPTPDVQAHTPRKMKKEQITRITPRLYQNVRAELMRPPQSFLDEEDEEDEEEEGSYMKSQRENYEEDADEEDNNIESTTRPPAQKRGHASTTGIRVQAYSRALPLGNGIRPALVWSNKGQRRTHILFV